MRAEISSFSRTGNTLAVARGIAGEIEGRRISIPREMKGDSVDPKADVVGIVFPVFGAGVPLIIKRFVEKMVDLDRKYILGICTYGDYRC
jgi:flavodoxin